MHSALTERMEVIMQLYIMDIRELERIDRPEELLLSDKRKILGIFPSEWQWECDYPDGGWFSYDRADEFCYDESDSPDFASGRLPPRHNADTALSFAENGIYSAHSDIIVYDPICLRKSSADWTAGHGLL